MSRLGFKILLIILEILLIWMKKLIVIIMFTIFLRLFIKRIFIGFKMILSTKISRIICMIVKFSRFNRNWWVEIGFCLSLVRIINRWNCLRGWIMNLNLGIMILIRFVFRKWKLIFGILRLVRLLKKKMLRGKGIRNANAINWVLLLWLMIINIFMKIQKFQKFSVMKD